MSKPEEILLLHIQAEKLPKPEREYRFHPERRWRFDFAWPWCHLAVEIDGGLWQQGRHTRAEGFEKDCEKLNAAAIAGWRVLRFSPRQVERCIALDQIKAVLLNEVTVR